MAMGNFIPWSWNINTFVAIFPLAIMCVCHLLLPVALNPAGGRGILPSSTLTVGGVKIDKN
jgi:hypothetical protein